MKTFLLPFLRSFGITVGVVLPLWLLAVWLEPVLKPVAAHDCQSEDVERRVVDLLFLNGVKNAKLVDPLGRVVYEPGAEQRDTPGNPGGYEAQDGAQRPDTEPDPRARDD